MGGVGGGGRSEAGGRLYLPIALFGVAMSPRSASHMPKLTRLEGLKRHLTIQLFCLQAFVSALLL